MIDISIPKQTVTEKPHKITYQVVIERKYDHSTFVQRTEHLELTLRIFNDLWFRVLGWTVE